MMQRLLRGRAFYVLVGLLAIGLHLRAFAVKPVDRTAFEQHAAQVTPHQAEHIEDRLVWLPKQLDRSTLEQLAAQEPRLMLALTFLMTLMAGILVTGVGLSLRDVTLQRLSSLWRFRAAHFPSWSMGELWRILCLAALVIALLPFVQLAIAATQASWQPDRNFWMTGSMLVVDGIIILAILAFAHGKRRTVAEVFGLTAARRGRSVRASLRGYVTAFPWLALLLVLIVEVVRLTGWQPPQEPITQLIFQEDRPAVLSLTMLLACVVGPIAEELLFRGVLYAAVRRRTSWVSAMLVSGGLFAAIHTNPLGFIPIMGLGCLLAYLYERTGSLAGPMVVHIAHNTLLMALAMTIRQLVVLSGRLGSG